MQYSLCRVSDESGSLEMTPINEMPLKKEHLDPYVSNITPLNIHNHDNQYRTKHVIIMIIIRNNNDLLTVILHLSY